MKSHTILNVVRHQGGKLRFGVINQEYLKEPKPRLIRIKNLTGDNNYIDVIPSKAYYSHGSIYKRSIHEWLAVHFPRLSGDKIYLLKFYFTESEGMHIFEYVGDSGYKKFPRERKWITPDGKEVPCPRNAEISQRIWGPSINEKDSD